MLLMAVATSCIDNMYPTANYDPRCEGRSYADVAAGGGVLCQTDNADLTFGLTSGTTKQKNYVASVLEGQFEMTNLSVSQESPVVYKGDSETDIVFQIGAVLPLDFNGVTWCENAVTSRRCDQHYVRLAPDRVGPTHGTTCHETGHAVGLVHGAQANPVTGQRDDVLGCLKMPSGGTTWLGEQNKRMINDTY